jgi:hypothetical protein
VRNGAAGQQLGSEAEKRAVSNVPQMTGGFYFEIIII